MLRDYQVNDLSQMCRIWNAVVAQGNAFPQLEQLDEQSGDVFFSSQSKTRVCIDEDTVVGLYILHPNNVGRCGHICNASFAVNQKQRGKHIGKALVLDCMKTARSLGFRILQFNAVVEHDTGRLFAERWSICEYRTLLYFPDGVVCGQPFPKLI